jgi:hypothetical protein
MSAGRKLSAACAILCSRAESGGTRLMVNECEVVFSKTGSKTNAKIKASLRFMKSLRRLSLDEN